MTMRTAVLAVVLAGPAGLAAAQSDLPPLLGTDDLVEVLEAGDRLVLDIRSAEGEGSYAAGHIEGPVSAPYPLFRGPEEKPGRLPNEAELTETLRTLGVTEDRPTVIVYQGADVSDFGAAARVYWTLKSSGVGDLSILNGGINAWTEAGLSLDDGAVTPEPSAIEASFSDEWLATEADVQAVISGEATGTLIDACSDFPSRLWLHRSGIVNA